MKTTQCSKLWIQSIARIMSLVETPMIWKSDLFLIGGELQLIGRMLQICCHGVLAEVKNPTEQQRGGESKRQNLAERLERLSKVDRRGKSEIESKGGRRPEMNQSKNKLWRRVKWKRKRMSGEKFRCGEIGIAKLGEMPAKHPSSGSWQTHGPKDQFYGLCDQKNKQFYGNYGDRTYAYNPYQDYSGGGVQNNTRQTLRPISEPYQPCKNFDQQENQPPRKHPGIFRENGDNREGNRQFVST